MIHGKGRTIYWIVLNPCVSYTINSCGPFDLPEEEVIEMFASMSSFANMQRKFIPLVEEKLK